MRRRTNVPSPVDSLVTQVEQLQQTDSSVEDGEIVWVRQTQCLWVYRQNSGLTPNGTDVVASLYGNGVWVRSSLTLGAAGDMLQTSWFIDPANGNDANTGLTSATALKTDAERQRRWGAGLTRLLAPTTVTYMGSLPSTDIVNYDVSYLDGASLTVVGVPTVTNSNITLTGVTTLNRAANPPIPWDITGVGLSVTDVGRIATINAGPRANSNAVVEKDMGGGQVRVSPFGNLSFANAVVLANPWAPVTPLIGDVIDVATLPVLPLGTFKLRAGTPTIFGGGPPVTNCVVFDSVQLDGTSGAGNASTVIGAVYALGGNIFTRRCLLRNLAVRGGGGFWMMGGGVVGLIRFEGLWSVNGGPFCYCAAIGTINGGGGVVTVNRGASVAFDQDCLFQNMTLFVYGHSIVSQVGFFDRASANLAFQVLPGGVVRSRTFTNAPLIYGDANAGVGCQVIAGGALLYSVKPTVNTAQGAGRQSIIGGVNTDWAAVPAVTAANNAMIVVDA